MPDTPLALARRLYAAYAARDLPAILAALHPDVEIVQTPLLPWGGTHRGLDGAQRFFRTIAELTAATPEPAAFIPAGDDVVVTGRLRGHARGTGAPIDLAIAHVLTVRGGKVVRFAAYIDTPAMLAALAAGDGAEGQPPGEAR
jgi:ketosteroid isomerase-like protein